MPPDGGRKKWQNFLWWLHLGNHLTTLFVCDGSSLNSKHAERVRASVCLQQLCRWEDEDAYSFIITSGMFIMATVSTFASSNFLISPASFVCHHQQRQRAYFPLARCEKLYFQWWKANWFANIVTSQIRYRFRIFVIHFSTLVGTPTYYIIFLTAFSRSECFWWQNWTFSERFTNSRCLSNIFGAFQKISTLRKIDIKN